MQMLLLLVRYLIEKNQKSEIKFACKNFRYSNGIFLSLFLSSKMKVALCLIACLSLALALPQKEGQAFSNDAIRQAQTSSLIPSDAKIENVSCHREYFQEVPINSL